MSEDDVQRLREWRASAALGGIATAPGVAGFAALPYANIYTTLSLVGGSLVLWLVIFRAWREATS